MKILKPGKVEMRKFVCQCCGCEYVAAPSERFFDAEIGDEVMPCPQIGCGSYQAWEYGEPYEEPTPTLTVRDRLLRVLYREELRPYIAQGAKEILADKLISHGVTFREG